MTDAPAKNWFKRVGWFLALWLAGVAVVGTIAFLIRSMIL